MSTCQRVLRRVCSARRMGDHVGYAMLCSASARRYFATTSACHDKAPKELLGLKSLDNEDHHRLAKEWTTRFRAEDIPKGSYETSYARSSGPGGQASLAPDDRYQMS